MFYKSASSSAIQILKCYSDYNFAVLAVLSFKPKAGVIVTS